MGVPGNANPLLLRTVTAAATGISRSLRFSSGDSAYLSRTMSSASTTYTFAAWVKKSTFPGYQYLFSSGLGGFAFLDGTSTIYVYSPAGGAQETTAVFRDPSAWYHIVFSVNSLSTTVYVNNVAVKTGATAAALSTSTNGTSIGRYDGGGGPGYYFNGYLADIYFIDGQALDPTSFGEFDATTGVWNPKAYTGSYGTNGAHLEFADNSSNTATTLGKDTSGNGNNWTPNNLSVTAGAGNDSLVDVPSSTGTDTGAGGEVRGNYCTWNPLSVTAGTFSQGNLEYVASSSWRRALGTFAVSTGKWYYEATLVSAPNSSRSSSSDYNCVGWSSIIFNDTNDPGANTTALLLGDNGYYKNFTGSKTDAGALSNGDVVGIAVDLDANTFAFYKSGSSIASGTIGGTAGRELSPAILSYSNAYGVWNVNFGQRAFSAGPSGKAPSGYKAICTTNLPAPSVTKPSTVMDVALYTGNGSTKTISGLGFSPDFVWIKDRSQANGHGLFDVIRGTTKGLFSNLTNAEVTDSNSLTAFNSDGFTSGSGGTTFSTNINGNSYVSWLWDAGSSTVTNTAGSITSSVRANQTAGFSIVTWTGSGSNVTIGHGLGAEPHLIITKGRSDSDQWVTYHKSIGATQYIYLNSTGAAATYSGFWNNTAPTSTVFTTGTDAIFSTNGRTHVAYCFAPVAGYSSMGSYTGNGSTDGSFVYTGMRPRWLLSKRTDQGGWSWLLWDSARETFNQLDDYLRPDTSNAETYSPNNAIDFLSNGFKMRGSDGNTNASGGTYIYIAFAESPFNYARAR